MKRIDYKSHFNEWPDGEIWMDMPMRDIPNTMISAIESASPQIKAVSISCMDLQDKYVKKLNEAAKKKGIHIVWVSPWHVRLNPPEE